MAGKRLNSDERARIEAGIAAGESDEEIAAAIGRARTTVFREIRRGGGRDAYRAPVAQKLAAQAGRHPKQTVLSRDPVLALLVLARLQDRWSPHAIAAWLRNRPDQPRCCAEVIYTAAYANDDRSGLPAGTWKLLVSNRRRRRARGRGENCKRGNVLGPIISITDRPTEAADRSVAGHWEGDLIKGAANASGVITLVDRATRFTILGRLPVNCSAAETLAALTALFAQVPVELRRSLTWDQGREMASWPTLVERSAMPVYFCDPHSPWQRPSNENTNRHLRRWLPKGTDLNADHVDLDAIAHKLNTMPRRLHNWHSAADHYAALECNNR